MGQTLFAAWVTGGQQRGAEPFQLMLMNENTQNTVPQSPGTLELSQYVSAMEDDMFRSKERGMVAPWP